MFKGRLSDASKKEKSEHEAKSEDDSYEESELYLTNVSNLLNSLLSNCEIFFNSTRNSNAIG